MTYPVAIRTADCDELSARGRTISTVAVGVGRRTNTTATTAAAMSKASKTKTVARRDAGFARADLSIFNLRRSFERSSITNRSKFYTIRGGDNFLTFKNHEFKRSCPSFRRSQTFYAGKRTH